MLVLNKIIKNIYNNLNIGIFFILSIPAQILILNNYDVISYHDLLVCFKLLLILTLLFNLIRFFSFVRKFYFEYPFKCINSIEYFIKLYFIQKWIH